MGKGLPPAPVAIGLFMTGLMLHSCGQCEERPTDAAPASASTEVAVPGRGTGGDGGDAAAEGGRSDGAPGRRAEQLPELICPSPAGAKVAAAEAAPSRFPRSRPYKKARFQASERHSLYFELVGRPDGTPVIVLHGGPGGMAGSFTRSFIDPGRFKALLFDQRGAGRSRPRAEYRDNTTQLLIADIEALRDYLGFDEPVILFGNSWGSTLAVAYAEAHPEKVAGLVLGGVFLCSRAEIDHFYHGGAARCFPDNHERLRAVVPHPERHDYPAQLFAMITGADPAASKRAIDGWGRYEIRMTRMDMTDALADRIISRSNFDAFSTLENHYMMNGCFLEAEGQLLRDAHKIAHIPASIVNGLHDAICPPKTAAALAQRMERVKLEIVESGAHSGRDAPLANARLRGLDWVADIVEAANRVDLESKVD